MFLRKTLLTRVLGLLALAAGISAGLLAAQAAEAKQHHEVFGDRLHKELNLDAPQEQKWQHLMQEKQSMRTQMRETRQQLREMMEAELARPNPDLAAVAAAMDEAHEKSHAAAKNLRAEALAFYAQLKPDQQKIVVAEIREHFAHMKTMGEEFR